MSKIDFNIKSKIEYILDGVEIGSNLINLIEGVNENQLKRVINIISEIYPEKTHVNHNEFEFVKYMFSSRRVVENESFSNFIRATSIINYDSKQKVILFDLIKENINFISRYGTFELGSLLVEILSPKELFDFLETLAKSNDINVRQQVLYILEYEDEYLKGDIDEDALDSIIKEISNKGISC